MGKRIEQKRNHAMLFIHSVLQHKKCVRLGFFVHTFGKHFKKKPFFNEKRKTKNENALKSPYIFTAKHIFSALKLSLYNTHVLLRVHVCFLQHQRIQWCIFEESKAFV